MKLFTYGDSWTEGLKVSPLKKFSIETRKKFRNDRLTPAKLSKLLGVNYKNQSLSGGNNNTIFKKFL